MFINKSCTQFMVLLVISIGYFFFFKSESLLMVATLNMNDPCKSFSTTEAVARKT